MFRCLFWVLLAAVMVFPANLQAFDIPEKYRDGIVVVHDDNMAPLSFFGLNRQPKGFIIDFWRKWSAETGVPVSFRLMNWKAGLEFMRSNEKAVHGGLFKTDERLKYLSYSEEIYPIRTAMFVLKESTLKNIDDLAGQDVGTLDGGAADEYMRTTYPNVRLKPFAGVKQVVEALVKGEVAAVVMDYPTIMYLAGTIGVSKRIAARQMLYKNYLRAAVTKGNDELLNLVARGFDRIDSKEREHILHRWFVTDSSSSNTLKIVVGLSVLGLVVALGGLFFAGRWSHRRAEDKHLSN